MNIRDLFSATAAASAVAMVMLAPPAQMNATAQAPQADKQQAMPITVVGCIQKESDYRREHDSGRGGVAGTGLGRGNEYILVNATRMESGSPASTAADSCASGSSVGQAYELTGDKEHQLEPFVGKRIQITGMLKEAKVEPVGTAGTPGATRPTGGFDPMRQDLKLFEINVESYRELSAAAPSASTAAAAPPSTPEPAATTPAAPQAQSSSATAAPSERTALPRTASTTPALGLIGLLAMVGALGIRSLRRS